MLFGSPLALLAAIYTSEFLHPRIRSAIKPLIELMASLPSVVLGFLAALVFAPFVEQIVPAVLAGFITIPFLFLLGAYIWQILPQRQSIRLSFRLLYIALLLPLGFYPQFCWVRCWKPDFCRRHQSLARWSGGFCDRRLDDTPDPHQRTAHRLC